MKTNIMKAQNFTKIKHDLNESHIRSLYMKAQTKKTPICNKMMHDSKGYGRSLMNKIQILSKN